jgi:hypothetical protein
VAPRLGRYAADVQFKMVRCAFDRDQLVLEHAARVIHLLQAAVDFAIQVYVVWEAVPRCEKQSFSANTIRDRNRWLHHCAPRP